MSQNHWISYGDEQFVVEWTATFPATGRDPAAIVDFGALLVDAGKQHRVWDAKRFARGRGDGESFEAYAREALDRRQMLALVFQRSADDLPAAQLAFHRGGQLVEDVISDVGALLRELRPDFPPEVTARASAVTLRGFSRPVDHPGELVVAIRLDTDIWFSRVSGLGDTLALGGDEPEYADNRAVAERHTRRLNAFLVQVREHALAVGGRWQVDCPEEGFAYQYRDQVSATGIAV